ncbi:hypothetical protein VR010_01215 [Actinomycetaceae bacterium L2_0104]
MEMTVFFPVNVLVHILLEPSLSGKITFTKGWEDGPEGWGVSSTEGSSMWIVVLGDAVFCGPLSAVAMPAVVKVSARAASVPASARLSLILLCPSMYDPH